MRSSNIKRTLKHRYGGVFLVGILGTLFCAIVSGIICGCAENRHAVVAITGTNIGLEISENPVTQMPQGKLGYQRSEISIVPSNRSGDIDPAGTNTTHIFGNGAVDVADVLMELRFANIFSSAEGGVYQRLAVGETAVSQSGAAFMFARDQEGNIDPKTAEAIKSIESIGPVDIETLHFQTKVTNYIRKNPDKRGEIEKIMQEKGLTNWSDPKEKISAQTMAEIVSELESKGIQLK